MRLRRDLVLTLCCGVLSRLGGTQKRQSWKQEVIVFHMRKKWDTAVRSIDFVRIAICIQERGCHSMRGMTAHGTLRGRPRAYVPNPKTQKEVL